MDSKNNTLSLETLFQEYSDSLFRYAFFRLDGDRETALDFVQETFYKMGLALASQKDIENPKAYLYRIISNLIIDSSRGDSFISLDSYMEETGYEPPYHEEFGEKLDAKIEVEKIYEYLNTLKDIEKDLFILRYIEELSPQEIALLYSKPVNAVTVRLFRLKEKITSQLTPQF